MGKDNPRCSAPGCYDPADWQVIAQDAGDATGKRFMTCERHGLSSDFRRPVSEAL